MASDKETSYMEYELKFTFALAQAKFIAGWLEKKCKPDPLHSSGVVTSVYYDSYDLSSYYQKRGSDYLKQKVRLRWYRNLETGVLSDKAFWEIKMREGTRRKKIREPSRLTPSELDRICITDTRLQDEMLLQQNHIKNGAMSNLFPVIMIRYTRNRYVDPVTGARMSVDCNIHAHQCHPNLTTEALGERLPMPVAIFEYKGVLDYLPPHLAELNVMGGKKQAFSKYESLIKWVKSNNRAM